MQQMGQHTDLFTAPAWLGKSLQWWAFILLFIGFAIKVPSVPLHTWLPDAHVEAPTPISMILAGVLLKMGGYGIIRICYPICPEAGYELANVVCAIGVVSMVYGAFAAMAQTDFKRLVAYSSVSHMGYVVLGLGVWSAVSPKFNPEYWQMGMNGAMFQMIAHGISSAGMFFMVGVIYDRVHHRDLNQFGGLFARIGLCGFIGEVLVVLSVWNFNVALAVISAAVVILTAGYILWAVQRVYLGPEYKGPHPEALREISFREFSIAAPLLALAIWFGVNPQSLLDYMAPSVNQTVVELTDWAKNNPELAPPKGPAQASVHVETEIDS
jgi:NADH-quinone oxidoreductase subunit M